MSDRNWNIEISHIYKNLFLSGIRGAGNEELIKQNNIKFIIQVSGELYDNIKINPNISYIMYSIDDHPSEYIIDICKHAKCVIDYCFKNNINILINCYSGISRSASIVIYYLMNILKKDYNTIYKFVKSKRGCVNPNYGFIKQLKNIE